ncbi:MAG TPA: retropepsin-like aspartic protease [Casimicrobiaceae bacterium]|nr:retropepsin-like aspartic protease [Casimicrobiaceae bacterium]
MNRSVIAVAALAACLAAGARAAECKLVRIVEWPVRIKAGHVVVDGEINGRKVDITLDTGASRSAIVRSAAERLELPRHDAKGYRMFGIGGELAVEIADVAEFKLGGTLIKDWRVIVAGDAGTDLLLGEDFLSKFDVEFDLAHGAVRLYEPRDCRDASLAYWTTDVPGEVEFERIDEDRPRITFTVRINGRPIQALLDSGAGWSLLSKQDAAALGVTPDTPGVDAAGTGTGLGARAVDAWIGPFESFVIGNETISDVRIGFADLWKDSTYESTGSHVRRKSEGQQPMLVGYDFLRAHRLLVAHSQRKLYFTHSGGTVFQPKRTPPKTPDAANETAAKPGN